MVLEIYLLAMFSSQLTFFIKIKAENSHQNLLALPDKQKAVLVWSYMLIYITGIVQILRDLLMILSFYLTALMYQDSFNSFFDIQEYLYYPFQDLCVGMTLLYAFYSQGMNAIKQSKINK